MIAAPPPARKTFPRRTGFPLWQRFRAPQARR